MSDVVHALPEPDDDGLPSLSTGARSLKLARWVDLLAALLGRNAPASFDELTSSVSDYRAKAEARDAERDAHASSRLAESLKRVFERDKDELRMLGVMIESLPDERGNPGGLYRLRRNDFYLPYLCIAVPGGAPTSPARLDVYGYKSLESLVLEPDELEVIVDAAASIRLLGDSQLRAEIDSAMRKLAVDLPLDSVVASPDVPRQISARAQPDAELFATLGEALRHRKVVTFTYHVLPSGETETRVVEPYGLFFVSTHWYLAAHDRARGEIRNFRLNRISGATLNSKAMQTPDYSVPDTFSLRAHAQLRQPWELGDGDALQVLVHFGGESGPAMAAAALGEVVPDAPMQRRFAVRRSDSFARWILSFGGEAAIISPHSLVAQVRALAAATIALYAHSASLPQPSASPPAAAPKKRARVAWEPRGAAAQFRRILLVVPQIADGDEHSLHDVASRVGTDVSTLQQDLHSLVARYDLPAGFVEGVQIYLEPDRVSARSNHLRRPMRLTVPELCALELGLAVLRSQRPPDEHAVLDRARTRLLSIIAKLPHDPIPDSLYTVSTGEYGSTTLMPVIRHGMRRQLKLRIGYRKSGSTTTDNRMVCPYALVSANGMLYLIALCERSVSLRVFRMDRVVMAEVTDVPFAAPAAFSVDDVLRDGRVFQSDPPDRMLVRYSARIAPWIAEREGRSLEADGCVVLEHPLADWEWGLRHALQYGAEAEVLEPESLRTKLRQQLEVILQGA